METLTATLQTILSSLQNSFVQLMNAEPTTQILVLLCLILVFLLILIARSFAVKQTAGQAQNNTVENTDEAQPITLTPETVSASTKVQEAPYPQQNEARDMENISDMDDFKIFKRSAPADQRPQAEMPPPKLQRDDELLVIEQNMLRLRELFHDGHITRDVYIDETRTLYHQAKALVKTA